MAANEETSSFESSEMLATFMISTPLLPESWRLCSQANATANIQGFLVERVGAVVYLAFSDVQMAGISDPSWRTLVPLEIIGGLPLFSSLYRNKKAEEPVMVHEGILNIFSSLFNSIQNQVLGILANTDTKSVVITGHSIGGATASLCTLWLLSYLQSISSSSSSVMCITFGSPLLGNQSFSQAISKEIWGGNFIHVVSKHDIMPRLLFAPITPLTSQLNSLLHFWHVSMTSPEFVKLAVQVSDKEKSELFTAVMDYVEAATQNGKISGSVLFHPFGNYFFVSEAGALCVDSPVTIIKMMHLLLSTSSPSGSIEDHLKYGEYVNRLSLEMLNQKNSLLRNIPNSSYEAGLELAIQSSGIENQESAVIPAKECLKSARRMGPSLALNAARLAIELSKVVPYRAQIEWYKTWCDEQDNEMGYYDFFKTRGVAKRDIKVNINRYKLARLWNNIIDMLEKNQLPHDFDQRAKWVNASQFYKLLVEPLDIAEYYGKGMHRTNGHYIEHGRERRYEIFDKWWKNIKVTRGEENKQGSKFASLTQDSCFWAKVEEAKDWLNGMRSERDTNKLAMLWEKIENFEKYAIELIQNKEVSCDVLAKNSSYSKWVGDLKEMKLLKWFESSEMLATLLISTPLFPESWRLCSQANAAANLQGFLAERVGAVMYVAFSGVQMAGGSDPSWRTLVPLKTIGGVPLFSSLYRNKEAEEPVMVHEGMLNLFSSLFNSIQNQVLGILENTDTKSVVITGHSIGGATASLCTVWLLSYLQSISSSLSVMCITFGSPLLGNKSFSQAISREKWGRNFIHVVSNHDIIPRLLFAPITPLTSQLNFLLPFWHLSTTSAEFGKLAVQVSDKEKAKLFTAVLDYLEAATHNGEVSGSILFHPFGNYCFLSEEGALCVDSPFAIIKMMHLLLSTSSPSGSIEVHPKYGKYVNRLSLEMLNQKSSLLRNIPNTNYEAGLELAIQSIGLADKDSAVIPAKECLKSARRMGPSPDLNAARLELKLAMLAPYRVEVEWYKTWCDEQDDDMGYYDSFKTRGSSERGMKVNINRLKLARFWDNVIDMLEKNKLPHCLDQRAKLVNASQFYKLLFEPLDIAEYYGSGMHRINGHYIEHGREKRYEIFDRWWKVLGCEGNKKRSKFASSTQDSCFWAKVEEARDWLNSIRSERDTIKLALLWVKIENFEKYAIELIQNKKVSCDVLAKNSSYSIWVKDLKELNN